MLRFRFLTAPGFAFQASGPRVWACGLGLSCKEQGFCCVGLMRVEVQAVKDVIKAFRGLVFRCLVFSRSLCRSLRIS